MFSDELVANLVCRHLLDLGLKSRVRKTVVETGIADLKVLARVENANVQPGSALIPLAFGHHSTALKAGAEDYLWDCSTGIAAEPQNALSAAVHNWIDGVLPVILAAHGRVLTYTVTEHRTCLFSAQRKRIEIWRVVVGAMQGNEDALNSVGDRQPFLDVLFQSGLINGLCGKEPRIWALRCFVSRIAGRVTRELRINWHDSEALNEILDDAKLNWSESSNPLILRQFVALVPTNEQPTPTERQQLINEMEKRED